MLPSAVRWNGGVIVEVALLLRVSLRACDMTSVQKPYFNDRHNIVGRVLELAHVHIKVTQLILLCLFQHKVASLPHCIDAPQVAGRVEVWVRRARERDVRDASGGCGVLGHCVFGVAVECERGVSVIWRVLVAGSAIVTVVAAGEKAHDIGGVAAICSCCYLVGRRRAAVAGLAQGGFFGRSGASAGGLSDNRCRRAARRGRRRGR